MGKIVGVIRDNRDKRVFIDEPNGMLRDFESELEPEIELEAAKKKYPAAVNLVERGGQ